MGSVDDITPLLIARDEIQNIERTRAKLDSARHILLIDNGRQPFDSVARQCNFGLTQICTEWFCRLRSFSVAVLGIADPKIRPLIRGGEVAMSICCSREAM